MKTKSAAWWQEKIKKFQAEGRSRTTATGLYFDDEFGPSYSIAEGEAPETWVNPRTKPIFYNDHVHDFLRLAIEVAGDLGAAPLVCGFPAQFIGISASEFTIAFISAAAIAEQLPQDSPEWLAVTCYMQWIQACRAATKGAPYQQEIADHMFLAGATARELELSIINRRDASRGRTTKRAASEGGKARRQKQRLLKAKVIRAMQELLTKNPSLTAVRAAQLVHKRGIGTSPAANRGLWQNEKAKRKNL